LFWVVLLPLMIIFSLGLSIGSTVSQQRVGVVGAGSDAPAMVRTITEAVGAVDGIEVVHVDGVDQLRHDIAVGVLDGGWIVAEGEPISIQWVNSTRNPSQAARSALDQAVLAASLADTAYALLAEQHDADMARSALDTM